MRAKFKIKSLILFLLLSQFVALAHAYEHQFATEDQEHCFICTHINDGQSALLKTPSSFKVDIPEFEKTQILLFHYNSKNRSTQSIRAPPSLH